MLSLLTGVFAIFAFMTKFGKWLGGGLGWAFAGPIGGLIGFLVGSYLDQSTAETKRSGTHQTGPGDFGASLLVLVAAVMKADGKVVRAELDYVKQFLLRQFGLENSKQLLLVLRDIIKKDIPVNDICLQIKTHMDYPARLELIHLLFGLAAADGDVHYQEVSLIEHMAKVMGIRQPDLISIKAMFVKDSGSAYKVLEIDQSASVDEIKKAYRKMASKYHPDKVSHLGEQYTRDAKEKFQKVQEAYETIKKAKGFN